MPRLVAESPATSISKPKIKFSEYLFKIFSCQRVKAVPEVATTLKIPA